MKLVRGRQNCLVFFRSTFQTALQCYQLIAITYTAPATNIPTLNQRPTLQHYTRCQYYNIATAVYLRCKLAPAVNIATLHQLQTLQHCTSCQHCNTPPAANIATLHQLQTLQHSTSCQHCNTPPAANIAPLNLVSFLHSVYLSVLLLFPLSPFSFLNF